MADQERKVKCPQCGWETRYTIPVNGYSEEVFRGIVDDVRKVVAQISEKLRDRELEEANAWIDMPKCANCGGFYRYNVRTGATQ